MTKLRVNKTERRSGECRETIAQMSHDYRANDLNHSQFGREWFIFVPCDPGIYNSMSENSLLTLIVSPCQQNKRKGEVG